MKKLALHLDELQVTSYEINVDGEQVGTVEANGLTPRCSQNTISCDGSCMITCDTCTPC